MDGTPCRGSTTIMRDEPRGRGSWAISSGGSSYWKSCLRTATYNPVMAKKWRAQVITCSDRAAHGEYKDESGPAVLEMLIRDGYDTADVIVVPDDIEAIATALINACARVDLVVTT